MSKYPFVTSDDVVGSHMFPRSLAAGFDKGFSDHGVTVRRGTKVTSGAEASARVQLQLDDGSAVEADGVVFGLGVRPSTDLAEAAGLEVDNGIVVDEFLRTADEHIYAAGDVANYPDAILGRRRIEHVDNATEMGKAAGRNMAGLGAAYTYTPYFYSDVYDDGYQAIGTVATSLNTVEDWKTIGKEGVVYYLDDDAVVRGVLMWNVWEGLDEAHLAGREEAAHGGNLEGVDLNFLEHSTASTPDRGATEEKSCLSSMQAIRHSSALRFDDRVHRLCADCRLPGHSEPLSDAAATAPSRRAGSMKQPERCSSLGGVRGVLSRRSGDSEPCGSWWTSEIDGVQGFVG